jgi:hypothetical protein
LASSKRFMSKINQPSTENHNIYTTREYESLKWTRHKMLIEIDEACLAN